MTAPALSVTPIRTRVFRPGEPLAPFVLQALAAAGPLDGRVLAVTSKIVALAESRVTPRAQLPKPELVRREADVMLDEVVPGIFLTVKHGIVIPSAGIDESNAEGDFYILYPEDPFRSARELCARLRSELGIPRLGVVLTDSHLTPLRAGVTGIALAHAGFRGVRDRVGAADLFGRPLAYTRVNVADALAGAAVFAMGEAAEACPLALIEADVEFTTADEDLSGECRMPIQTDLFGRWLRKP
jgi:F420-0:gamma-glutamyl ligase